MRENIIGIVTAIVLVAGFIAASVASHNHMAERCAEWGSPNSIACQPHN